jgi:hypothetical protein
MLVMRGIPVPLVGTLLFWLVVSAPALAQTHCH